MPDEIEIQKLKRDYPEFFEKTSPEIVEFALSEKTSSQIAEICVKNGVKDERKIEEVARRIVFVLLEKLPKENLHIALEKGVGLDPKTAKEISNEVDRVIFSQMPLSKTEEIPRTAKEDAYREQIE